MSNLTAIGVRAHVARPFGVKEARFKKRCKTCFWHQNDFPDERDFTKKVVSKKLRRDKIADPIRDLIFDPLWAHFGTRLGTILGTFSGQFGRWFLTAGPFGQKRSCWSP